MSKLLQRHRAIISGLANMWSEGWPSPSLYDLITQTAPHEPLPSVSTFFDTVFKDLDKYGRKRYPQATKDEFEDYLIARTEELLRQPELDAAEEASRQEAEATACEAEAAAREAVRLVAEAAAARLKRFRESLHVTQVVSQIPPYVGPSQQWCKICLGSGWIKVGTATDTQPMLCWYCHGLGYV